MALYIPASKRRRRVAVLAVVALVAGLVVGLIIGRLTAGSVDDAVRSKQDAAEDVVARLDGLGLEYQQTVGNGASASDAREGSRDAAADIVATASDLVRSMPWVPAREQASVIAAVKAVQTAVEQAVPPAQLTAVIERAEAAVRAAAGTSPPSS